MIEAWFETDKEAGWPATAIKKSSQSSGKVSHLGKPKPLKATMIPMVDKSKYNFKRLEILRAVEFTMLEGAIAQG